MKTKQGEENDEPAACQSGQGTDTNSGGPKAV